MQTYQQWAETEDILSLSILADRVVRVLLQNTDKEETTEIINSVLGTSYTPEDIDFDS